MSLAADVLYGIKGFMGNNDIVEDDTKTVLTKELEDSIKSIDLKAEEHNKNIEKSVSPVRSSERIITAPNIPIVGSIIGWFKKRKVNAQLQKAIDMKIEEESTILNKDDTMKAAIETNSFTNPNGKNTVKTKAARKDDKSNPRELGGEERIRKGR